MLTLLALEGSFIIFICSLIFLPKLASNSISSVNDYLRPDSDDEVLIVKLDLSDEGPAGESLLKYL